MTEIQSRQRLLILIGATLCGLAVLLGAFGAHALESSIGEWYDASDAVKKLASWETAVRYQFYHGLAILLTAMLLSLPGTTRILVMGAWLFLAGIFVFCGGLYLWVLTDVTLFVIAVPAGGVSFMLGWLAVFIFALSIGKRKETNNNEAAGA